MTLGELIKESGVPGIVVLFLAATSIAACACALSWLRRSRLIPPPLANGGELSGLVDAAKTVPGVMAAALVSSGGEAPKARAAVRRAARELLGPPLACVYALLGSAVLSPMVGIVGTSAGMAQALASLRAAETSASPLAEALLRACSSGSMGFAVGAGAFALYALAAWKLQLSREALEGFAEEVGGAP